MNRIRRLFLILSLFSFSTKIVAKDQANDIIKKNLPEETCSKLFASMNKIDVAMMYDFKLIRKPMVIRNGRGSYSVFFDEGTGGYRELRDASVVVENKEGGRQELILSHFASNISTDERAAIDELRDTTKIVTLSKIKDSKLFNAYEFIAKLIRENGTIQKETEYYKHFATKKIVFNVRPIPVYKESCWVELDKRL